jgi:hypothetical protein
MVLREDLVYQLPERSFRREIDEALAAERFQPYAAIASQLMFSGADRYERVLSIRRSTYPDRTNAGIVSVGRARTANSTSG